jgi:hypothetical protein
MPYELEFEESAIQEVEQYLDERFPPGPARNEAISAIDEALQRLASDPIRLGKSSPSAFSYPTHTFKARIQNMDRLFKVVFCYGENERTIWILGFKPLLAF